MPPSNANLINISDESHWQSLWHSKIRHFYQFLTKYCKIYEYCGYFFFNCRYLICFKFTYFLSIPSFCFVLCIMYILALNYNAIDLFLLYKIFSFVYIFVRGYWFDNIFLFYFNLLSMHILQWIVYDFQWSFWIL